MQKLYDTVTQGLEGFVDELRNFVIKLKETPAQELNHPLQQKRFSEAIKMMAKRPKEILWNVNKNLEKRFHSSVDKKRETISNNLPVDVCINFNGNLDQNQLEFGHQMEAKIKTQLYDIENFVKENMMPVLQYLAAPKQLGTQSLQMKIEIIEKEGQYFQFIKVQHQEFSFLYSEGMFEVTSTIDKLLCPRFIPACGTNLINILKEENGSNVYKVTCRKMLWEYFTPSYQAMNLLEKQTFVPFKSKRNLKPDKNAYPFLFNWIIKILLNQEVEHEQNEVERLVANLDKTIEEISSIPDFENDIEQIKSLRLYDFIKSVQYWDNAWLLLSALSEKLKQVGIGTAMMKNYHKDYQKPNPSFKRLYRLQDEKQLYFWIIVMAVTLKELPLKSENSPLMCWIFQNPNMGLELKMNLLNEKMLHYYYQKIEGAQNILGMKFEERSSPRMKELLKETLEIIDYRRYLNTKRPAIQDLGEEVLRPIHKTRILNTPSLEKIQTLQQKPRIEKISGNDFREKLIQISANRELQREKILLRSTLASLVSCLYLLDSR